VAAVAAGAVTPGGGAAPGAPLVTTIDRTLSCAVDGSRAQRGIGVSATTRTANTPTTIYANHNGGLANVFAGIGPNSGLPFTRVQTPPMAEWLWLNRQRCRRVDATLRFTRQGLTGGRVGFHDGVDCSAPPRVLVRIRATFVRDTGLAPLTDAMFVARSTPRRAELAVADASNRRPIAYLRLDGPLRVSLFARPSCRRY
jgi:hypothetical protein